MTETQKLSTFLKLPSSKLINLSELERQANIPSGSLDACLKGRRKFSDKYVALILPVLKKLRYPG